MKHALTLLALTLLCPQLAHAEDPWHLLQEAVDARAQALEDHEPRFPPERYFDDVRDAIPALLTLRDAHGRTWAPTYVTDCPAHELEEPPPTRLSNALWRCQTLYADDSIHASTLLPQPVPAHLELTLELHGNGARLISLGHGLTRNLIDEGYDRITTRFDTVLPAGTLPTSADSPTLLMAIVQSPDATRWVKLVWVL